jgi:hypothetical protein
MLVSKLAADARSCRNRMLSTNRMVPQTARTVHLENVVNVGNHHHLQCLDAIIRVIRQESGHPRGMPLDTRLAVL